MIQGYSSCHPVITHREYSLVAFSQLYKTNQHNLYSPSSPVSVGKPALRMILSALVVGLGPGRRM